MPSSAPGSLSSERGGATATQTAALALWREPWPSPGRSGSRSRVKPCRLTNRWKATRVTCPRGTHCPRLRRRDPRRPAETPGSRPAQVGRRPAPATAAAGEAPESPPLGGPGARRCRAPQDMRNKERSPPRSGNVPTSAKPPRTSGTSTSSATANARRSPLPIQQGTPSLSRSTRMAPPSSTATSPSPGTWPSTWRPSESRRMPGHLEVHEIAGGGGREQGPWHVFPRPARPGLFPQAPRRPCRPEGCGCLGKTTSDGLAEDCNPSTAALPRPPPPCSRLWVSLPPACLRGRCATLPRSLALGETCGTRGSAVPGLGDRLGACRPDECSGWL